MTSRSAYALMFGLLAGLAGVAHADTICVPQDQGTINAAIGVAKDGDVIEIKGGKYTEDVVVNGIPNLTIVGKGAVTLMATDTALSATNCNNLTIQKIRTKGGNIGFLFQDCAGVLLEKFSVRGVLQYGVRVLGGSNIKVRKGRIGDSGRDGVSFADEAAAQPVAGGEISKVKIQDCSEDGVDLVGSDITVSQCKVRRVGDDGYEADDQGTGGHTFDRCTALLCGDEGFEIDAPNTTCTNCKSIRSDEKGFDVDTDDCRLENCTSVKARESGFEVEDGDNVTLIGCKAIQSSVDGFALLFATNCTVTGCKAIGNKQDGFYLDSDSSGNTLRDCKGARNKDADLDDESGGQNSIDESNKFKNVDINT